jgi:hypothetical protein
MHDPSRCGVSPQVPQPCTGVVRGLSTRQLFGRPSDSEIATPLSLEVG